MIYFRARYGGNSEHFREKLHLEYDIFLLGMRSGQWSSYKRQMLPLAVS